MLRILALAAGAIVLLAVLWWLFWGLVHLLVLAFWVVLVVAIGVGLFRVTRWSSRAR
jgi:hypothetical protein